MSKITSSSIDECLHIEALNVLQKQQRAINAPVREFPADEPLIYDTLERESELLNMNTEEPDRFFQRRYLMLGSVFSETSTTIKLLTPYFIKFSIDPQHFKSSKKLAQKVKADALSIANEALSQLKEGRISLMNKNDVNDIANQVIEVGYGIQELQRYMQWSGDRSVPEIFLLEVLAVEDDVEHTLDFLIGGFAPQYYFNFIPKDYASEAARQSSYSLMSVDDFMKRVTGSGSLPSIVNVEEKDYSEEENADNEPPVPELISFDSLKKEHPGLGLLEFYVPIVIELDKE